MQIDYALAILDGADERLAQRVGMTGDFNPNDAALAYEAEVERKQQAWLKARPPK